MEPDLYIDGNILLADYAVLKTGNQNSTEIVAGSIRYNTGYSEGQHTNARFTEIRGFSQINATHVMVVDFLNHCVRLVNRLTNQTSPFFGQCTRRGFGRDGLQSRHEVFFSGPLSVIKDPRREGIYLLAEEWEDKIRELDITTMSTETKPVFRPKIVGPMGLAFTADLSRLLVNSVTSLASYNYDTGVPEHLYGSDGVPRDGSFDVAQHLWGYEIIHLSGSKFALCANGRILVADIDAREVMSFCNGECFIDSDDSAVCDYPIIYSLMVYEDALYAGHEHGVIKFTSKC